MLVTTQFFQEHGMQQTTTEDLLKIVQLRNSMFRLKQTSYGYAHRVLRSAGMELHIRLERFHLQQRPLA